MISIWNLLWIIPLSAAVGAMAMALFAASRDDVVRVVRCEDCKYVEDFGMGGLWCGHPDHRNPCGCCPSDYCNNGRLKGPYDDKEKVFYESKIDAD